MGADQAENYQGSQELYDRADINNVQEAHMGSHTETAMEGSSINTLLEVAKEESRTIHPPGFLPGSHRCCTKYSRQFSHEAHNDDKHPAFSHSAF